MRQHGSQRAAYYRQLGVPSAAQDPERNLRQLLLPPPEETEHGAGAGGGAGAAAAVEQHLKQQQQQQQQQPGGNQPRDVDRAFVLAALRAAGETGGLRSAVLRSLSWRVALQLLPTAKEGWAYCWRRRQEEFDFVRRAFWLSRDFGDGDDEGAGDGERGEEGALDRLLECLGGGGNGGQQEMWRMRADDLLDMTIFYLERCAGEASANRLRVLVADEALYSTLPQIASTLLVAFTDTRKESGGEEQRQLVDAETASSAFWCLASLLCLLADCDSADVLSIVQKKRTFTPQQLDVLLLACCSAAEQAARGRAMTNRQQQQQPQQQPQPAQPQEQLQRPP